MSTDHVKHAMEIKERLLRERVAELEAECKAGAHMTAKLTDRCRELEALIQAAEKLLEARRPLGITGAPVDWMKIMEAEATYTALKAKP